MPNTLKEWMWISLLLCAMLYPSFSKAVEDDRCGAASERVGSVKPNDAASSEKILPPTEAFCKTLKEDIKIIAEFIQKNPGGEEYLISMMNPVDVVDGLYGPGTHARISKLIHDGYAATDLRAWMNKEWAKCHGIVKPADSSSEIPDLLYGRGEKKT